MGVLLVGQCAVHVACDVVEGQIERVRQGYKLRKGYMHCRETWLDFALTLDMSREIVLYCPLGLIAESADLLHHDYEHDDDRIRRRQIHIYIHAITLNSGGPF